MTRSDPALGGAETSSNGTHLQLTQPHRQYLRDAAITDEVLDASGAYSVGCSADMPTGITYDGPGIVFLHRGIDGATVAQYRPDEPTSDRKYIWPTGPVPIHDATPERIHAPTVLIVEGTKQTLAAASWAPRDVRVIGIAGCWVWSRNGAAVPELATVTGGKKVVICFDADVASNPKVHEAASRLGEHLAVVGASEVRHLGLPAGAKVGLDDYLGALPAEARHGAMGRLVDSASKLPKRPPRHHGRYFGPDGLKVRTVAEEILDAHDLAVHPDGSIWRYADGVYRDDDPMGAICVDLLAEQYRPAHRAAITEVVTALLRADQKVLTDEPTKWLNVTNGMLDVRTGQLHAHDPRHLSTWQIPHAYDPAATCPRFEKWVAGRVGAQAEGLLEAMALALVPSVAQRKTLFLFGPARSGKSTCARVIERIMGPGATTSVSLHSLASNRFAAANLYGSALNVAGDLSDHHVDDLSTFKQLTGDDLVSAERKFRDAFTFRNWALFLFTANQPPTVSETSSAYLERIWPVAFPDSVAGREDRTLDAALAAESEGILALLVRAAQSWITRGDYLPLDAFVGDHFAQQSDASALFAAEVLDVEAGAWVSGADVYDAYVDWTAMNRRSTLGRNKFLARLEKTLGTRKRAHGSTSGALGWRDFRIKTRNDWEPLTCDLSEIASFARSGPILPHSEIQAKEKVPKAIEVGNFAQIAQDAQGVPPGSDVSATPPDDDEIISVVIR